MLVPIVRVSYVIAASQDCIMCSIPVLMAYKEIKISGARDTSFLII